MLAWTIYLSFAGALACLLTPRANPRATRAVALGTALAGLFCGLAGAIQFKPVNGLEVITRVRWIPALGIDFSLAADGISVTLVLLTGIAALAGVLFSWNVERRTNEFFAFFFALIGGVYGVFLSLDLFLLFVFYEIAIVPKYFLIAIWGSTRRDYAAMKLALYSFIGSGMVLIGMLAAYAVSGHASFDLQALAQHSFAPEFQRWAFPLVFVGFAILAGMWPFHTWAPTGHSAAPTAASMLLAGVVMKLGAYGCLRVAMTLFPEGLKMWQHELAALAVTGIVYGALVALVQKDFKFVIGYSSVSHMGFVLLGLAAANSTAVAGAVLQMFSHGVIAGLLFAVVGRMVYERTHTRQLADLRQLPLHRLLPFAALTFVLAGLASMGMPGFSGFPAELTILIGVWKTSPAWAFFAGGGILVAAAFTLRAIQVSFFGSTQLSPVAASASEPTHAGSPLHYEPITLAEKVGTALLLAATVYIGLKPDVLLDWITPALQSPLMQAALKGGSL